MNAFQRSMSAARRAVSILLSLSILSGPLGTSGAAAADPLRARVSDHQIAAELVVRAYRALLFREPDAETKAEAASKLVGGGMARWKTYLSTLARGSEFRRTVRPAHSDEEILAQIYEHLLGPGRPVDPSGRRAFLPLIASGQITRVVEAVGGSAEFIDAVTNAAPPTPRADPGPEPAPRPLPSPRPEPPHVHGADHLEYFGYFLDDGLLDEVADHANLTAALPGSDESGDPTIPVLQEAKRRGMKVLVHLQGIGLGFRDEASWREKWEKYVKNVGPYISKDTVAAFYMYDEPALEMTPEFIRKLEIGAEVVRETFPGIPIALNFGWWSLSPDLQGEWPLKIPAGYDWLGFDCYGPFENCIPGRPTPVRELFNILKSKLQPGQRIFLIPDGTDCCNNSGLSAEELEDRLIPRADQYLELALSEPLVIAYIPFLWSARPEGVSMVVRDLPRLREKYREIGQSITGRR